MILLLPGRLRNSGSNYYIVEKIMQCLSKEYQVLCPVDSTIIDSCSPYTPGFSVTFVPFHVRQNPLKKLIYTSLSKVVDRNGFSDYLMARELRDAVKQTPLHGQMDAVFSCMEPFAAADAASELRGLKRILFLIDPPAELISRSSSSYRKRRIRRVLGKQDLILTTPFILEAMEAHGFSGIANRIIPVGFPMIEQNSTVQKRQEDGRIHLLFCGWLYSEIRSPKYFLDVLSRLDERFVVTFMGRECEKLTKRFEVHTKAELVTLPQQPYETALQAMADADILINIGNSVPVHMPSKTLEYINTGKPFVNFYKLDDCPTFYYTKRYPLCLNISEQDPNIDTAAERFVEFCVQNKGKTVNRDFIEREYEDCTPKYIAKKILDALGE